MSNGIGHVYKTNHTTQISIRKINSKATLKAAKRHNERLGDKNGAHVDERRNFLNENLTGTNYNYYKEIVSRIVGHNVSDDEIDDIAKSDLKYADKRKVRKDAILAFEAEMKYPGDLAWSKIDETGKVVPVPDEDVVDSETVKAPEKGGKGYFLYPANEEEFESWKTTSIEFLKARFGENNLLSAELHMDEFDPHIHAVITPSYEDEKGITRLSYAKYLNGPADFKALQTEYAESLSDLGYERGAYNSERFNYGDINSLKAMLAISLPQELPEDKEEALKLYRAAVAKQTLNDAQEKRANVAGTIRRQNKTIEYKNKKIEELEAANENLSQRIEAILPFMKRYQAEAKGLEKFKDRDLVDNIYKPLQEQMIQDGIEFYKLMGIDMSYEFKDTVELDANKKDNIEEGIE